MRLENKRMQAFLAQAGIKARAMRIHDGSCKQTWRIYNADAKWSQGLADKMNSLGFRWIDSRPLDRNMGNGGIFSVCVRGHDELASPCKRIDA
jgi:hypothetical protein